MVCFCVTKPGAHEDARLSEELKNHVSRELGKPLRPAAIKFISQLPKTRNAKVMRRIVRAIYLGKDPGDVSALENPAAVEEIRKAL